MVRVATLRVSRQGRPGPQFDRPTTPRQRSRLGYRVQQQRQPATAITGRQATCRMETSERDGILYVVDVFYDCSHKSVRSALYTPDHTLPSTSDSQAMAPSSRPGRKLGMADIACECWSAQKPQTITLDQSTPTSTSEMQEKRLSDSTAILQN